MFVVVKNIVIGRALAAALLACLNTRPAGALLTTPTLHLGSGIPPSITPDSDSTGWTEAAFSGYAAIPLTTWSGPVNLEAGWVGLIADSVFTAAAPFSTADNATFWWIDTGAAGPIYLGGVFDGPIPFAAPGDFLALQSSVPVADQIQLS